MIQKEDCFVKLGGKRYLFDEEWVPYTGIRLLKENTEVLEVNNEKPGMGRLCERMAEGRLNCSSYCGRKYWMDRTLDQGLVVERRLEGIIEFLVLRLESPVFYLVRVMDSLYNRDFQKRVLRMATHFCR